MGLLEPQHIVIIILAFLLLGIPAILGYKQGKKRTIGGAGGLIFGLFLGFIGLLIVTFFPKDPPSNF
jgi:hypothetical protein